MNNSLIITRTDNNASVRVYIIDMRQFAYLMLRNAGMYNYASQMLQKCLCNWELTNDECSDIILALIEQGIVHFSARPLGKKIRENYQYSILKD